MFVRKYPRQMIIMLATAALILAGCNVGATPAPTLDVSAINTAIVGTTVAQLSIQFTQTALAQPSATPAPTDTATVPTFALATSAIASPTTSGVIPTISFNTTPVANTPIAGFTQLASPAPAGGVATQVLGDSCNNAVFGGDVTVADGTVMKPGQDFEKVWTVRNTGSCTWDEGYEFVFIGGDTALDPVNFKFTRAKDFTAGGTSINIGIDLTAPLAVGKYSGTWRMRTDKGYYFGDLFSVYIEVKKK